MEGVPPPTHDSALPRVQVPIFSGDLGTFANFNAIYKKMVHEGPYSNTVKLTYLRSFLKGEPLQLIENLAISDANYPLAYNKIQKMYGASRTLASFYLNKLFEFKPLTNDSYADLQSFLTVFDSTYQAYLNVDIPYHEDYLLVHMCLNLLPKNLRLMFERSFAESDDVPSYSQVIKFVNDQCRVKALMGEPKPSRGSRIPLTPPGLDTSGLSLNDRLLTGPSLQKDIAEIVTLFRLAPVAVTCDIEKMFRNVKVDPRDRHVQRVLYRERETDPLVQYEINTLVYGLSSSPFLAQRTLQQLVADEGAEFPLASKAILECCFMDDIAYALSDLQTAKRYKDEMVSLMRRGGFELRKWASNSIELLQDIPAGHQSKLLTLTNE
ncbi:unnamed protein product, partial [Nesidiocoris tenuis]